MEIHLAGRTNYMRASWPDRRAKSLARHGRERLITVAALRVGHGGRHHFGGRAAERVHRHHHHGLADDRRLVEGHVVCLLLLLHQLLQLVVAAQLHLRLVVE